MHFFLFLNLYCHHLLIRFGCIIPVLLNIFSHCHFCITAFLFFLRVKNVSLIASKSHFGLKFFLNNFILINWKQFPSIFQKLSLLYHLFLFCLFETGTSPIFLPCLSIFLPYFPNFLLYILGHILDW